MTDKIEAITNKPFDRNIAYMGYIYLKCSDTITPNHMCPKI